MLELRNKDVCWLEDRQTSGACWPSSLRPMVGPRAFAKPHVIVGELMAAKTVGPGSSYPRQNEPQV
jgi:hypothetical protein